jgi:hypothetical protein
MGPVVLEVRQQREQQKWIATGELVTGFGESIIAMVFAHQLCDGLLRQVAQSEYTGRRFSDDAVHGPEPEAGHPRCRSTHEPDVPGVQASRKIVQPADGFVVRPLQVVHRDKEWRLGSTPGEISE